MERKSHNETGFSRKTIKSNSEKKHDGVLDLLKGVSFTVARDGPDLYLKALKRLGIYACATYKNGSEMEMCLEAEELILPEELVLPENPMVHKWKIWDLCFMAMIKNEDTLKQSVQFLYVVVMSLCDSNIEDKGKSHEDYAEINIPGTPSICCR